MNREVSYENMKVLEEDNENLRARVVKLERLVRAADRAMGGHDAPSDCYATGPMTGRPVMDLVECPACSYFAMREEITL